MPNVSLGQFCIELFKNGSSGVLAYFFLLFLGKIDKPIKALVANIIICGVATTYLYLVLPQIMTALLGIILYLVFMYFFCKGSIKEKVLLFIVIYVINAVMILISFFFLGFFNIQNEDIYAIATFTLNLLLSIPIYYMIAKIWRHIKLTTESGLLKSLLLLPISQLTMCFLVTSYLGKTPENGIETAFELTNDNLIAMLLIVVLIISLIADGMLLNSFVKTAASITERERLQALEYENEHIYEYVKNLEGYVVEMRRYRHDMLNTFSTMRYSLSNGEEGVSDTLRLIDDTEIDIKNLKVYHYCECNFVNCILAHEESKASEAGVACVINAGVPEKLEVSEIDLCRVLTNLMDNAIACSKETSEKNVFVDLKIIDGYLYIVVSNHKNDKKTDFKTQKEDKINHGLGMGIIEKLTQRHGGALVVDDSGDKMTITATMKWEREE